MATTHTKPSVRNALIDVSDKMQNQNVSKSQSIIIHRVQINMTQKGMDRINNIKILSESSSNVDIIRDALKLYEKILIMKSNESEFLIKEKNGTINRILL